MKKTIEATKGMIELASGKVLIDPFYLANKHPQATEWGEEAIAKIRLAEKVYKLRTSKGYTMAKLATQARTTPAVIARIEAAEENAGIELVFKVFKALGRNKLELELT